ncbi:uncharacterized protein LOC122079890 [Macadamia integrifolia]|uniref:uncharacterized protein LOC122079890 n=1 Tax=Macadamia integrifolia TaxID=60698 RepID=UPI001C4FAE36|nr:uncharacterized protein LOC122079890 [Macadamia integrifolia]
MGLDVMEIGVSIRRGLIFPIRTFCRSVRDHPFYWAMVFFFIFLYRYFPSLFGLLISSSPVLVCTAALLGILLNFGNPNIPEIEKDDKRTHDVTSLKAAVVENDLIVQKDESFSSETHLEKGREVEESVVKEPMGLEEGREVGEKVVKEPMSLGEVREAKASKVDEDMVFSTINDSCLMHRTIANEEEPKEILREKQMIKEGEFGNVELVEKREFHEESLLGVGPSASKDIDGTTSIGWEVIETPRRKIDLPSGAFSISQNLSWKHAEGHSESYDSDSDRTESSSPDASMADIMPILDELHPLLESEASQPPLISLGNSNAASESSNRSHDGSAESEEEAENHEEEDEEEEAHGTQGDGTKDVVTWTEDDQKNLMDLGTLELERNRRLESLIAKRRLRKLLTMEAEKNLIDLESNDPPFSIAPILITKRNPFDLPFDSYEAMGLPPIPGSAPSVLLPRRNPFDLPYEPYEEKPNLMDDSFQQEFTPFQPKDLHFRRHESFSLGVTAEPKQRRHFGPYFVNERMASEGEEYPMFQRQLSEKSDSKVSSVPETESASSVADQEDHKTRSEQEFTQEVDLISQVDHASDNVDHESQSSKEVDPVEIDPEEKRAVKVDVVDVKGIHVEGRPMHVSDHVEHESQSSEELEPAEVYPEERRDFGVDGLNMNGVDEGTSHEVELHRHQSGSVASFVEPDNSDVPAVEERYSDSSSSSSEVHEKLFHMDTDEGSRDLELKRDDSTEGSSVSNRSSLAESEFNHRNRIMEGGDESQTKEPVYDSSPSEKKTLSNMTSIQEALFYVDKGVVTSTPSVASDLQVEVSEISSSPVLVDREDAKSVYYEESTMEISHVKESSWVASPNLCAIEENELRSMEVTEISECDVIEVGFSAVSQNADDPHVPKMVVGEAASGLSPSSLETQLGEVGVISKEEHFQSEQDQVSLSSSNAEVCGEVHQHDANMNVDTMASSYLNGLSSSEGSGSSKMEKSTPLMEEFTVHLSTDCDHEETQESSVLLVKSDVQATENEDSSILSMLTGPFSIPPEVSEIKFTTVPTNTKDNIHVRVQSGDESRVLENQGDSIETIGMQVSTEQISEEAEGIKEIDEGLLSELDTVGDFSVKELGVNMDQKENKLSLEEPESLLGLQVLGDRPVEDFEVDSVRLSKLEAVTDSADKYWIRSANFEVKDRVMEGTGSTSESQVLEASTLGNLNVDFKHVPEGDFEKSVVVESIHSEPLSKETEVEFAEFEQTKQDPNPIKIGSEISDFEARSLKDMELASKKLNQGVQESVVTESVHDKSITGESEIGPSESGLSERDSSQTANNSERPVLEARSLEDFDMAFKQFHGGDQKPMIIDSFHNMPTREETEVGVSKSGQSDGETKPNEISSELSVLEEKSVEGIDLAIMQLHGGDIEKNILPESVDDRPPGRIPI